MGIYDELGVKKYINATATITMLGGSVMDPRVLEAMTEASKNFVSINELQEKAGDYIAKITNNEAAFISNGAAAGMMLSTAACIAGTDPDIKAMLPFTDGLKNEIIVFGGNRVPYDFAIKQAGGKVVEYGTKDGATVEQLEAVINDKTAAIFVFYFEHAMDKQIPLDELVKIANKHNVPVIVDAAAQLPCRENLWKFTKEWGVDAAIFSGGKGLRGPQSSGLVVGKKWLVDILRTYGCPNGGIGRPLKVGKEEMIGLLTAVKLYMECDMEELNKSYEEIVQTVIDAFANDDSVAVTRDFPNEAGQPMARAKIILSDKIKADAPLIAEDLKVGEMAIHVAAYKDTILINPQTMFAGEIDIVIERLKKVLNKYKN